ncbi:hypothetical protein KSP40_PGU016578 [Platanthera guangdongensis]|uniref:Uncharacterized protein n=1 Tax=Platanthera guangdongensis TaxID=2320717 RepID=A0ABR2LFQ7_9ASPA
MAMPFLSGRFQVSSLSSPSRLHTVCCSKEDLKGKRVAHEPEFAGYANLQTVLGDCEITNMGNIDMIVVSPGVPLEEYALSTLMKSILREKNSTICFSTTFLLTHNPIFRCNQFGKEYLLKNKRKGSCKFTRSYSQAIRDDTQNRNTAGKLQGNETYFGFPRKPVSIHLRPFPSSLPAATEVSGLAVGVSHMPQQKLPPTPAESNRSRITGIPSSRPPRQVAVNLSAGSVDHPTDVDVAFFLR